MPPNNFDEYDLFEEAYEIDGFLPKMKNALKKGRRPRLKDKYNLISESEVAQEIFSQQEDLRFLDFTYQASKTERGWLIDSLGRFYEEKWFDDILQIVKGGKEASVYQLLGNETTGAPFLAGKVYRPRIFRALKNDHIYRQGRANLDADGLEIVNEGKLKALDKRSAYGKQLETTSWLAHEIRTMRILYEAGCDVPRCYAGSDSAILMEYIGDEEMAAPTLNTVRLPREEARLLFERLLENVATMLSLDIIHGDLSAFNLLYMNGKITIIDFPQAIHPEKNRNAFQIFERDVVRVCEYFSRQGVSADGPELARWMWRESGWRVRPAANPAFLDPDDEGDRAFWEKQL